MSDAGTTGLPSVTLNYAYDPAGNRTSMTDSLGGVVSYTYDARNELTNLTLSGTGLSAAAVSFAYDNQGNMTGLTRYSNLAETTVVAATSYTYDPANQLTGITDKNAGGTTLVSYGYTYDAAGRVTQEARTWAFGLLDRHADLRLHEQQPAHERDAHERLVRQRELRWDANGNQTGTGYTTTTGNEQTASPGYTYTYDADGNMITATQTSTGDVWTYSYDFRNRMTGAVEKTSGGTVLAQATYTYDALDNRIGTDENGTQTWTLYDGGTPVMDFTGSGSLAMRYLNGPAGDVVDTVLARESAEWHGLVVLARPAGDDPRPDQQLGLDHRPRGLQRLRDAARRVEPVERRPDDGLRGDGAGYGHGAEPGGVSGRGPGDGEVDEPGSVGVRGRGPQSVQVCTECTRLLSRP